MLYSQIIICTFPRIREGVNVFNLPEDEKKMGIRTFDSNFVCFNYLCRVFCLKTLGTFGNIVKDQSSHLVYLNIMHKITNL